MNIKVLIFGGVALVSGSVNAQVKISTTPGVAATSAAVELESTNRGLLLPRMTSTERGSISTPATGLVIYNTTLDCVEMYDGAGWACLDIASSPNASALGSTYTSPHGSAATAFSTNSYCSGSLISAGYSSGSCSGSVTVGSNSYAMVYINGQCWMQTNLKEAPSNYSYNNTWLNDKNYSPDSARYGYYNTGTTNGSAGFQATEPAAGEGYLYQWNAAMNGSLTERAQGACPNGWHIPSDCEWMYLEHGLGMSVVNQTMDGPRNNGSVGSKLSLLTSGGTNSSGFTALLTGTRDASNFGAFDSRGGVGYIWTSSISIFYSYASMHRYLTPSSVGVARGSLSRAYPIAVRCLRN